MMACTCVSNGLEKMKGTAAETGGASSSYSFNGPKRGDDPEMKRKKRIAAYNSFAEERWVKASLRSSMRWLKSKLFPDPRYS